MDILRAISELVAAPGVTGAEQAIGEVVKQYFSAYTQDVWQDKYGNVYGRIGQKNRPEILIMAHMDEIGLMVTKVEENGILRMINVGGVDPRVLPGSEVLVLGEKPLPGVIGAIPPHLTGGKMDNAYQIPELICDIGYDGETARKLVHEGDYITFAPKAPLQLKNGYLSSKTLDDRALVAVMLECMERLSRQKLQCSVVFCASVQEERSGLGGILGAYSVKPDMAIAIDVCHGPTPGVKPFETAPMDKVVLTKGSNIHEKLLQMLQNSAKEQNIATELEIAMGPTGTDAWTMQVQRGGIPCAIVSPPLRYMHTSVETIRLETLHQCAKVLSGMIAGIDEKWEDALCLDD